MSKKKTRICPHCKKEVDAMATRCPYCTSKITPPSFMKFIILLIIFIVAMSLIYNFLSKISSSKKENISVRTEVIDKEKPSENGKIKGGNIYSRPNNLIGISDIDTEIIENETYLTTTVSYNLSYPVIDLVVEFDIYDTENNKVGYCASTNNLKNYEEWNYKAKIHILESAPQNFTIDRAELLEPSYKEIIEQ